MTLTRRTTVVAAIFLPLFSMYAAAAPGLPNGAKPADGKTVVAHYANTSVKWSEETNPDAGIFFRGDGVILTIWKNQKPEYSPYAVGIGSWTVTTRGTQCYQATWYSLKNGALEEFTGDKWCRDHRVDADGNLYARDAKPERGKSWWRLDDENGEAARTKSGNQFARKMEQAARLIGIELP